MNDKVQENRVRRMADRQGLLLRKQRRRDPRALDYGRYMLVDADGNYVVAGVEGGRAAWTLNDCEQYLTSDR